MTSWNVSWHSFDNFAVTSSRLTSEQKWFPNSFSVLTFTFTTCSSSFFSDSRKTFSKNFFVSSGITSSFVFDIVLRELKTELYSCTTLDVFLRNFPFDFGECEDCEAPGLRNFFDLQSSGERVGLLPGNKNETIEFFREPGFNLLNVDAVRLFEDDVDAEPMHSLLLAGVILTLSYKIKDRRYFTFYFVKIQALVKLQSVKSHCVTVP